MNILISACLMDDICKYDGGSNRINDVELLSLLENFNVIRVCPEVLGGLNVPRPPAEIIGNRVINCEGKDVTDSFALGARLTLNTALKYHPVICIFKESSPSCGVKYIYNGEFNGTKIKGQGLTAKLLSDNGFKVYSELMLDEIKDILRGYL